jgi:hypothetical protein
MVVESVEQAVEGAVVKLSAEAQATAVKLLAEPVVRVVKQVVKQQAPHVEARVPRVSVMVWGIAAVKTTAGLGARITVAVTVVVLVKYVKSEGRQMSYPVSLEEMGV